MRDQNVGADIHIVMTTVNVNQAELSGKPIPIDLVGPADDDVRQRPVKAFIILLELTAPEPLMGQRLLRQSLSAGPPGVLEGVADKKSLGGLHTIAQQNRALPVGHPDLEKISANSRGPLELVNGEDDARIDILQRAAHRLFLVQVVRDRWVHRPAPATRLRRGPLFSVDDRRVLRVDTQDVHRLVIHVMNLANAAVACSRRDAGVAGREQDDTPGFGPSNLRTSRSRACRYRSLHVEGDRSKHRPVAQGAACDQRRARQHEYQTLQHGFPLLLRPAVAASSALRASEPAAEDALHALEGDEADDLQDLYPQLRRGPRSKRVVAWRTPPRGANAACAN